MSSQIPIQSNTAELRLTAISLKDGEYHILRDGLLWQLTAEQGQFDSQESQPKFIVPAGEYQLKTSYAEKILELNLELVAGELRDEVVFFDVTGEVGAHETYALDDGEFNPDTEYERRQLERDGQPGEASLPLHKPPEQFGQSGQMIQGHPLLAQSAQFSGMDPKMSTPDQNPNAAEQLSRPEMQPNPSPNPGPTPTQTMAPRPF